MRVQDGRHIFSWEQTLRFLKPTKTRHPAHCHWLFLPTYTDFLVLAATKVHIPNRVVKWQELFLTALVPEVKVQLIFPSTKIPGSVIKTQRYKPVFIKTKGETPKVLFGKKHPWFYILRLISIYFHFLGQFWMNLATTVERFVYNCKDERFEFG